MRKMRVLTILAMVLFFLSSSCKKSEKTQEVEVAPEAVQINIQGEAAAPATPLLFKLDGRADDWAGIAPFWEEAIPAGAGLGEDSIDIKQVYFKNDAQYLYGFMRISPTIEERFKISPTGDIIGNLFLDTDNNPQTGSNAAEGENYQAELYKGYEMRVWIPVGVISSGGQSSPTVSYEIYTHEGGFYRLGVERQNSLDEGSLIAHGPDGVEFALRLEALKLAPPATFRVTLNQHATPAGEEGYSVGQLTLETAK